MPSEFSNIILSSTSQPGSAEALAGVPPSRRLDVNEIESVLSQHGVCDGLSELASLIAQGIHLYSLSWVPTDLVGSIVPDWQFAHQLPLAEDGLEQLLVTVCSRCSEMEPVVCVDAEFEREIARADTRAHGDVVQERCLAIATRVVNPTGESGILGAVVDRQGMSPGQLDLSFRLIANSIRIVGLEKELLESRLETGVASAVVEVASRLEGCVDFVGASQILADETRRHTGSTLVAIGRITQRGGPCRVTAIAGSERLSDEQSDSIEAALNEVLHRESLTVFSESTGANQNDCPAAQRSVELNAAGSLVASPLCNALGVPIAVLLCLGPVDADIDDANVRFIERAGCRFGASLELIQRAQQSGWRRGLMSLLGVTRRSRVWTGGVFALLDFALR